MLVRSCFGLSTNDWFGIHVVDESTGRGVPLVELETVNHLRFITDNAGWVAIQEPGWAGQTVHFLVKSHGYTFPKDGFGFAGFAVMPKPGQRHTVKIKRLNLAERLYRITGEGLYRDSALLGEPTPTAQPFINAQVVGQDSAQVVRHGDRLYWFFGDTSRLGYPLGQFHTSGAWTTLPGADGFDPRLGVDLHYWTNKEGFSRGMCPLDGRDDPYLVWIDGLVSVPDANQKERLVTHYLKMKTLGKRLSHGLAVWNEKSEIFESVLKLADDETWRFVVGHPCRATLDGTEYVLSGDNFFTTRVPARYGEVINPARYEAYTCLKPGKEPKTFEPDFDNAIALRFAWKHEAPPLTDTEEKRWIKAGLIKELTGHVEPLDMETGKPVKLHYGNTRWSEYRKRWITLAVQSNGTSALGEVWYCESKSPTGPWTKARKVVTHEHYSFYNPFLHDASFDQDGGRIVYFEGTYSNTFSGNAHETSRYDYNQIMYRLDLDKMQVEP
ncbi:MAG TPA: hypothetical protein VMF06_10880 [Candidatus Limnocylindria bacterium]|jgi:hypothetical protein|nr:hypothetical protein [Candidatus Limnocylindria bacterium]